MGIEGVGTAPPPPTSSGNCHAGRPRSFCHSERCPYSDKPTLLTERARLEDRAANTIARSFISAASFSGCELRLQGYLCLHGWRQKRR
jgi:hypothetical protein